MRPVTFVINISLDGYCDHTVFSPGEGMMDYFTSTMDDVDLLFYGRVMYQLMFPYWSDVSKNQSGSPAENRFADRVTSIEKIVVSSTLTSAGENTQIIRSSPATKLRELKQQAGGKISVDSVSMLPELITAGLIDKFHLVVHPLIAGKGRRLMEAGSLQDVLQLKLADVKTFESGCLALHYEK